jgi:hypothetical protein
LCKSSLPVKGNKYWYMYYLQDSTDRCWISWLWSHRICFLMAVSRFLRWRKDSSTNSQRTSSLRPDTRVCTSVLVRDVCPSRRQLLPVFKVTQGL